MSRRLEAAAAGKGSGGMGLEHLYRLYKVAKRLPDIRGQLEAHSGTHAAALKVGESGRARGFPPSGLG